MPGSRPQTTHAPTPTWMMVGAACVAVCASIPVLYTVLRGVQAIGSTYAPNVPFLISLGWNTIGYGILAAGIAGVIGTAQALLLERTNIRFRALLRVLVCLPFVIPPYISALCFLAFLRPRGIFEKWLVANDIVAFGQLPFDAIFGIFGSSFVLGICLSPYVYFPVSATIHQESGHYDEMAKLHGVDFWRRQLTITLPKLAPASGGGMMLVLLYALADFGVPALLRLPTFSTAIYARFAGDVDRAGAALLSMPLMAITVMLLLTQDRLFGHGVTQVSRSWTPPRIVSLGTYAPLSYGAMGVAILLSIGIPVGMLLYWIASPMSPAEQASVIAIPQLATITAQTIGFSLLISLLVITAAVVCARVLRQGGFWGYLWGRIAQTGYALPGIVVALSVVLVTTRVIPIHLGGLIPLALALFIRFIPQAIQGIDVAMLQITPTIEDAGRSMGHTVYRVLRHLIVPLSAPGIQTTWALIFLGLLKELPATLILRPAGFDTLAVRVWMPTSDGFTAAAAMPAFIIILCACIPFTFIMRSQRRIEQSNRPL